MNLHGTKQSCGSERHWHEYRVIHARKILSLLWLEFNIGRYKDHRKFFSILIIKEGKGHVVSFSGDLFHSQNYSEGSFPTWHFVFIRTLSQNTFHFLMIQNSCEIFQRSFVCQDINLRQVSKKNLSNLFWRPLIWLKDVIRLCSYICRDMSKYRKGGGKYT